MFEKKPQTLSEHREHFAKFVSLLTGEFGVQAVFGDEPGSSGSHKIVLPKIEDLDAKRLDFLYALCLREAGLLSLSKRSVASIATHKSQGELAMSFAMESGRVERALMRKFAGASEILDQHWKKEASDPELSAMAFGLDPKRATKDQTFAFASKWALVGRPNFGWGKLFPENHWNACVEALSSSPFAALINDSRLRKWEDARELGGKLWDAWTALQGGDKTPILMPTAKAKALADAEKTLRETIPNSLQDLNKKREDLDAKAKEALEKARSILGSNQARLDELNKQINALGKQKAPYSAVAEHIEDAHDLDGLVQAHRHAAAQAQEQLNQNANAAVQKKEVAEAAAKEHAAKDGAKQNEIQSKRFELVGKLDETESMGSESPEIQHRLAELEKKIEQAQKSLKGKTQALNDKLQKEQAKADAASGSKKEQLEAKVSELQNQLAQAMSKTSDQKQKWSDKSQEIATNADQKATAAKQRIEDQIADLEERLKKAMQEAQDRQNKAMEKAKPGAQIQNRMAKAQNSMQASQQAEKDAQAAAQNARNEAAKAAKKVPQANGMSEEELLAKIEELQKAIGDASDEKHGIEQPARDAYQEAREAKQQAKAANEEAALKAYGELQKLQEKMDAQGIECDLVERLEEIEGWPEANDLQRKFDQEATEWMGKPVINGAASIGHGGRNALEEIALKADGISEINPNEIFAGSEKLSPLAGFSQSGDKGGMGLGNDGKQEATDGFESAKPHLVWRKERDKVIPAAKRDGALVTKLTKKFAAEIAQTKRVFQVRMKPSYKPKFRGGREEGQIDGRSVWKLAAKQGDDFYEIDVRKPDNKASAIILVDISGSLSSLGLDASEKIQASALMLSEGLSECNIEHEILGFSAPMEPDFTEQKIPDTFNRKSCRLETLVAKGFTEKNLSGLASLEVTQAENSDGESLRIAINRLKKRSGKKKIIFLISDCKPFMQDSNIEILDEDLRRASVEAATQKISIVSIGFGGNEHPIMGKSHIGISELKDLPKALDDRLAQEK